LVLDVHVTTALWVESVLHAIQPYVLQAVCIMHRGHP